MLLSVAQVMLKIISIIRSINYWTDSEITLYRVNDSPSKFVTFVANRIISQIQELSNPHNWHYVPSELNPADFVSRGMMPSEITSSDLWWDGPWFLRSPDDCWLRLKNRKIEIIDLEQLEIKKSKSNLIVHEDPEWDTFDRYSDFDKLVRVVAVCVKFSEKVKSKIKSKTFSVDLSSGSREDLVITAMDIKTSIHRLIKNIQGRLYREDIVHLKGNNTVKNNSKLKSLSPFIDNEGLLRVGGRLKKADIPYESQHQLLLPSNHRFTIFSFVVNIFVNYMWDLNRYYIIYAKTTG